MNSLSLIFVRLNCYGTFRVTLMTFFYNTTLSALLDKQAPLRTRSVEHKTRVTWFTDEIRSIGRLHRQSERKLKT